MYPWVSNVVGGWVGRLSNRGEAIEILDDAGVQIDRVRYADEGDWMLRELGPLDRGHRGWIWAAGHDGGGKSLELINADMPNDYGQNWAPSNLDNGSPGMKNTVYDENVAPFILDVTHTPIVPRDDDEVVVTARIMDELRTNITATLHYRVDVSEYQGTNVYPHHDPAGYNNIIMFDDGKHGDGAANDRTYGAAIPAQRDGTVVEFYIETQDAVFYSRTWPAPSMVDGIPEQDQCSLSGG